MTFVDEHDQKQFLKSQRIEIHEERTEIFKSIDNNPIALDACRTVDHFCAWGLSDLEVEQAIQLTDAARAKGQDSIEVGGKTIDISPPLYLLKHLDLKSLAEQALKNAENPVNLGFNELTVYSMEREHFCVQKAGQTVYESFDDYVQTDSIALEDVNALKDYARHLKLSESTKSELLAEYLSLDKQQTRYAKALIHQHSKKDVPDTHPEAEYFESIKTIDDFAYFQSHPETVTSINEELNGWGIKFGTDFEAINIALCGSIFRHQQFEILGELGFETAIEWMASNPLSIPGGPYDLFKEDVFVDEICKKVNPQTTIEALKLLPPNRLERVSPEVAEEVSKLIGAEDSLKFQYERAIQQAIAEQGLTAQDFLGDKTAEELLAEHQERKAWHRRKQQTRLWFNTFPFLKAWHCEGCCTMHIRKRSPNYCDRCVEFKRKQEAWFAQFPF